MDQFSDEPGEKTFSIPLIRLRGKNATENILFNPGGPGASGIELLREEGEGIRAIVGEGYHLVSFDPRGVGGSQPAASCYPDEKTRQALSRVRASRFVEDSPELYAWSKNFAFACAETMGEHGAYLNTPQTAADMNSILKALGQKDMIYWGFSYGTILGQTYGGMYPELSKRIIVDGVANQFLWYDGHFDTEEMTDTEAVLDGFFEECIKARENCTLSSITSTKEELKEMVTALGEQLRDQPTSVYINSTFYGLIDYHKLWIDAIRTNLYESSGWYGLADNLAKLLQGNATAFFLAYGQYSRDERMPDSYRFLRLNDHYTGARYWPQDRVSFLTELLEFSNQSVFALAEMKHYYTAQSWTIPRTHPYVPKHSTKTAHPVLILSMTFDPVCPLVSARNTSAAFEGSRVVEVEGYGHCSISVTSACAIKHIREYLHNGKLPDTDVRCKVDTPYFSRPEIKENSGGSS